MKDKIIIKFIIILLLSFIIFFSSKVPLKALDCFKAFTEYIFSVSDNEIHDIFIVEQQFTGNYCDTTTKISNIYDSETQKTYEDITYYLDYKFTTGVYKIVTPFNCYKENWSEWCKENSSVELLSEDYSQIQHIKDELKTKQIKEEYNASFYKYLIFTVLILIFIATTSWPWIIIKLIKNKKINPLIIFIIAIIIQIIIALIISRTFEWSYDLWRKTCQILSKTLYFTVFLEIIYLIFHRLNKTKAVD